MVVQTRTKRETVNRAKVRESYLKVGSRHPVVRTKQKSGLIECRCSSREYFHSGTIERPVGGGKNYEIILHLRKLGEEREERKPEISGTREESVYYLLARL